MAGEWGDAAKRTAGITLKQADALFEAGDLPALQAALERLVNDRDLRVAMGKTAWKDASERFSGRIVLQGLESVYSQLQ